MNKKNVFIFTDGIDLSFINISPGDWVVIKPNLVKESKENDQNEWRSVITNPDLIWVICEYVCDKLGGKGRLTICDAPQTDSSFTLIAEKVKLYEIAEYFTKKYNIRIDVIDLRNEEWKNEEGIIAERRRLQGDPEGVIRFDLGRNSLFYGYHGEGKYYGADYASEIVNSHHHEDLHEYLICATPIKADVFINMPKLKTHKKTGVTLSLKNLVGINADKNWLPHHTEGSPKGGGDQFPESSFKNWLERKTVNLSRKLALNIPGIGAKIAQKMRRAGTLAFGDGSHVIRSGNWYGNDTAWRMVLDLNRCLLYGNPDGTLRQNNQKRYYSVIDGIIGMEGMGPMQGEPVNSNVVVCGSDPVVVDMVAARIMGFDWRKIPLIREAFNIPSYPITLTHPNEVVVKSNELDWNGSFLNIEAYNFLNFRPPLGWIGHIEYEKSA